jgi:hypothetical protein
MNKKSGLLKPSQAIFVRRVQEIVPRVNEGTMQKAQRIYD